MELTLATDRLILRPLELSDIDLVTEMYTDPVVVQFIGSGEPRSVETIRNELPSWTIRRAGGAVGRWCIQVAATGEKVGNALLVPLPVEDTAIDDVSEIDLSKTELEVGYIFKSSAWGKGYATEACRCLIRFAFEFLPLDEIAAVLQEENTASWRVLEKSGLTYRGPRRAYARQLPDFRISREQWLAGDGMAR